MGSAIALTPRVRTMVICDSVRKCKTEPGVFHLKGVRQSVVAAEFPFVPARLWLFLVLASPRPGRFPGYIRVVHERTDKAVLFAHLSPNPEFDESFAVYPASLPIRCVFPEPGLYVVQVWFFQEHAHDVLKGELPISVELENHS